MTTANKDIRTAAFANGVRLWQVAAELGVSDFTLSRKLRYELPTEEKEKILDIIENLSAGETSHAGR